MSGETEPRAPQGGVVVGHVRMFNADEAAKYLGTGAVTIRRAWHAGTLKGVKDTLRIGSPLLFTQADLDAFRMSRLVSNQKPTE